MKSTRYLYGTRPATFARMPYEDALAERNRRARLLIVKLMRHPYRKRDDKRVAAVLKAIKHNENLLEELK